MPAVSPEPSRPRYLFIDLFRTIIILLMLEGHVVRQFLSPEMKSTTLFFLHEIFHGITAPAFLFGAGLTFVISSHRRWKEYHRWGPELERRFRRILMIFCLGIFLHLPFFSFRKVLFEATPRDLLVLFQSDVLTCISVGLLTLHLLLLFFRREDRFQGAVIVSLIVTVIATPVVWEIDFLHYTPLLLAQLSNSLHGSPFPLFPFLGYLFAGVAVSNRFVIAAEAGAVPEFMKRLAIGGTLAFTAGLLSAAIPFSIYRAVDFWYTSPAYFLIRLGVLFVATAAVWRAGRSMPRALGSLLVLGKESLLVYVLHLLVLYGSVLNATESLVGILPAEPGLPASLGVLTGLTALMYFCARWWNGLKTRSAAAYRMVQVSVGSVMLFLFFTNDY
jgi:uncharacterized membrane protein